MSNYQCPSYFTCLLAELGLTALFCDSEFIWHAFLVPYLIILFFNSRWLASDALKLEINSVCRKCIYKKLSDEGMDCCPVCDIELGCLPVDKLSFYALSGHQLALTHVSYCTFYSQGHFISPCDRNSSDVAYL
ncbi:hypothetical protein V6N13_014724 [Hibiscus sabdariffa]